MISKKQKNKRLILQSQTKLELETGNLKNANAASRKSSRGFVYKYKRRPV